MFYWKCVRTWTSSVVPAYASFWDKLLRVPITGQRRELVSDVQRGPQRQSWEPPAQKQAPLGAQVGSAGAGEGEPSRTGPKENGVSAGRGGRPAGLPIGQLSACY